MAIIELQQLGGPPEQIQGLSNKEIAVRLVLSPYTVRFHISEILEKIGASTRAEAAALAIQRHLLD